MKNPIKFRGKSEKTGEFVYGGIFQNGNQFMIINVYFDEEGYPYPDFTDVESESVAQFVGYDKNGAEIYSDDKIFRKYSGIVTAGDFFNFSDIGRKFDDVELIVKEVKK